MDFIKCDVSTICLGECLYGRRAAVNGAGQRLCLPNSMVLIHQPSGGAQGQQTEIAIVADFITKTRNRTDKISRTTRAERWRPSRTTPGATTTRPPKRGRRLRPGSTASPPRARLRQAPTVEKRTGYMNDRRDDEFEGRDADIACAFCGKQPHQVAAMISGPNGIYICDECISVCADAMMRDRAERSGPRRGGVAEGFSPRRGGPSRAEWATGRDGFGRRSGAGGRASRPAHAHELYAGSPSTWWVRSRRSARCRWRCTTTTSASAWARTP